MKIIITIPAYNEEKNIAHVIKDIKETFSDSQDNIIIQVVDDGSTDNTKTIAEKEGARVISHNINKGLTKTFQTEVNHALTYNPDIIVHIDADRQYNPRDIPKLLTEIKNGYDIVLGSRFQGHIENMPFIKKIGNKIFSFWISTLSKEIITDSQTGFRAFTPEIAKHINFNSAYTYTQEQILKAIQKGYTIKEVPINFYARKDNTTSRLMCNPFHYAIYAGINVLRVYRDLQPLTFFGIIGLFLIIPGILLGIYFIYLHLTIGIKGHLGLLFLMILLLTVGFQIILFAFLADMKKGIN